MLDRDKISDIFDEEVDDLGRDQYINFSIHILNVVLEDHVSERATLSADVVHQLLQIKLRWHFKEEGQFNVFSGAGVTHSL